MQPPLGVLRLSFTPGFPEVRPHRPALASLQVDPATWHHLTGAPPAGWSTAEPVNLPWSTRQLTDLARQRAPQPTWLIAVGHTDRPHGNLTRLFRPSCHGPQHTHGEW
ncbi:DUF6177 family protein [Streptomyces sp. BRA346]|uniref:DUF6177 family protein n=1 Tax=Streptomyces sp. BRA346 TaxID=2878199 RepID=UPI0040645693